MNYDNITVVNISNINDCFVYDTAKTCTLQYWFKGVIPLLISIVGIVLNVATIYVVFPKKPLTNIFNVLLVNLFAWDAIFLFLQVLITLIYYILCTSSRGHSILYRKVLLPFWNIALSQSIFMTVALSVERYICINHPTIYEWCLKKSTSRLICYMKYVLPVTIFSFLFHILDFYINGSTMHQTSKCYTSLRKDHYVATYYNNYARLLVEGIIPLACIIYCNVMVYMKVKKHFKESLTRHEFRLSRSIEHALVKSLIGIVSVFVVCQVPNLIFRFGESIYLKDNGHCWNRHPNHEKIYAMYPFWIFVMEAIANMMLTLNSSVNVVVYCFLDANYKSMITSWINKVCKRKNPSNSENPAVKSDSLEENIELRNTEGYN